jgi:hypothetical protein
LLLLLASFQQSLELDSVILLFALL